MPFNFHTHCNYCDGKGVPADFVAEAVKQNFTALGFSSHAPVPFENSFSIKEENIPAYVEEIRQLQRDYSGQLSIYAALECDYIPGMSSPFRSFQEQYQLDYIIGGVHLVKYNGQLWFIDGPDPATYDEGLVLFNHDIQKAVGTYFSQLLAMIENEKFDVVAHLDKIKMHNKNRFFQEDEKWYRDWIEETLCLIKEKSLIVEINTRGIYKKRCDTFYPSPWVIERLKELSIPVTISSDAHHCSEISLFFDEAKQCLKECGIKELVSFSPNGWMREGI